MIKLFNSTDKFFDTNGDKIIKPFRARVHNEDNGDYYLDIETDLSYINDIVKDKIIIAPTPQGEQGFRIGNVTKTRKKITARCKHIFYDSENYLIADSYVVNKNCQDALNHLNNATDNTSPFTMASDINTIASFRCVRDNLEEAINVVLDRWGGHLVRDNFNISIMNSIGQDNGITIRYAKNLKEITCEETWDNVLTKILPVGKDGILLNALTPSASIYIESSTQYDIPYTKTISFSQDINQEDYPTERAYKQALINDLRAQATAYLNQNCIPKVNYKLKAHIDNVDIGDTIVVIDERLGLNLNTKVISYDYDCLLEKYQEIEFGNFSLKLSNLINTITNSINNNTTQQIQNIQSILDSEIKQVQEQLARNIVTRSLSDSITDLTQDTYTIVPLDLSNIVGDKLEITADGGIKIGANVNKITVSGMISFDTVNSTGDRHLKIVKNSYSDANTLAWSDQTLVAGQPTNIKVSPVLANVNENDVIYLYYYTPNTLDVIGGNTYGEKTSLTVEVVS